MEFHLEKHAAKVAHINLREEKHGEEAVLAVDVKITADVPNDFLSYLAPELKWSIYDKQPGQGELIPDDTHLPHLRYPQLGELKWDGDMAKAQVTIHGAKPTHDFNLDADVNGLRLEPKEGGTVAITFRLQLLPTSGQSAALVGYLGKEVKISVVPAESETSDAKP